MIPKVINYCWFGGKEKPKSVVRCINSWKKFFPDYEIVEWNENNFNLNSCVYVKEAYEQKKWAFVSDFARFKILYENGGLYFDTDVRVIKDMSDLLAKGPFFAVEPDGGINAGLGLAAPQGLPIYEEILNFYKNRHFDYNRVFRENETVVRIVTDIMKKYGFNKNNYDVQIIDGIYIYPSVYFCPISFETGKFDIHEETVAIHEYSATWQSGKARFTTKVKHFVKRILKAVR